MARTTPRTWVTGETVTAALLNTHVRDNMNVALSQFDALRGAAAYKSNPTVFNTDAQEFDERDRLFFDQVGGDDFGTLQLRVMSQVQVTAAGTGVTSFGPRFQALVEAASGATGAITTNINLHTATPIAVALTTGFKYFDSGWVNFASLATNISAYGFSVLKPRWRLDHNGSVAPTCFHLAMGIFARVA